MCGTTDAETTFCSLNLSLCNPFKINDTANNAYAQLPGEATNDSAPIIAGVRTTTRKTNAAANL